MSMEHKKKYGIYHWDTFDNETFMVDEADDLDEAKEKVQEKYGGRIRSTGADQVDIVDDKGNVVEIYHVG